MPWLLKVVLVGALLGACVFLAAAIPFLPARLAFIVAGGFVFLWSMRDPAMTYRRAFHFLIVLPAIPLGFSASAAWFGAENQEGGIFKLIVDSSQALPPWLWFGLAALCVIGDAIVMGRDRTHRGQLFEAVEVEAEFIEACKLVQAEFPFRPTRNVAISGAIIRLRGIGDKSDRITTEIRIGRNTKEATRNTPQQVAANSSATVTVKLELSGRSLRQIQRRRSGPLRRFPIRGAVKLRADSRMEVLPIALR
jgi:hypothetical protein